MATAIASVKLQRISARKARLVMDLIRHKSVQDAIVILNNTQKKATHIIIKLLNSAIANAVNNHGANADELIIEEAIVNEGPTLKRFQPRSQGRANTILKRTSHFSVKVSDNKK